MQGTKSGYLTKSFHNYLVENLPEFSSLPYDIQHATSSVLYAGYSGRYKHNKGVDGQFCIFWDAKEMMFGSARVFDQTNTRLSLFTVAKGYAPGRYARAYELTDKANGLCESYFDISRATSIDKIALSDKGLITGDGTSYRMPPNAIRSRTSTGTHSRFKGIPMYTPIEIDGMNLNLFHEAATAWIAREDAPEGFEWIHEQYAAIRDGNGPNAGKEKADYRAYLGISQASMLVDIAKRSKPAGYVIPTTYVEHPSGRLYAENAVNLQGCVSEVRKAALKGCYDIDIENCHWTLLREMASYAGVDVDHINHYLRNKKAVREQLASHAGISIEDAKFVLISLIYGARLEHSTEDYGKAICDRIGHEALNKVLTCDLVMNLHEDLKIARKAVIAAYKASSNMPGKNVIVNDAGRMMDIDESTTSQQLSHILQGAESEILKLMVANCQTYAVVLQHDGFTAPIEVDLTYLESIIKYELGYDVKLSQTQI